MDPSHIEFDDNYSMIDVIIDGQASPVCLTISDGLASSDQALQPEYKEKIANFINSSNIWLPIAKTRIFEDAHNVSGFELMTIFILYEQEEEGSVYGLLFNLDVDVEHGRGMMISGEDFSILKYGGGSVAFEGVDR